MRLSGSQAIGSLPPLADTWRRAFVELVGTFALVFVGAGTIMSLGPQADAGTLEVALATGLIALFVLAWQGVVSLHSVDDLTLAPPVETFKALRDDRSLLLDHTGVERGTQTGHVFVLR